MKTLQQLKEAIRRNAENGVMLIGCSDVADELEIPVHLGHNNVAWPKSFTDDERTYWRAMMEMPGLELPEYDWGNDAGCLPFSYWHETYEAVRRRKWKRERRWQFVRWVIDALIPWR
jgi:hypothetical protein